MPGTILLGSQWGDEGKGKICDLLTKDMDMVVRFQGGNNAGHTVEVGDISLKLHHIPSGILYPKVVCVIGDGALINPSVLLDEIKYLEDQGIGCKNLFISSNAHLIMPYHLILDREGEIRLGSSKIGTTRKGIGPAYADKTTRIGIRVQDLLDMNILEKKIQAALEEKNLMLTKIYNVQPMSADEIIKEYVGYTKQLKSHIVDGYLAINDALDAGKNVLFEGAQGTLLDIDHGTYPFVTSSSTVAGGACAGAGVGPLKIDNVIGVVKAYVTRVGSGPFPTEDLAEDGSRMRERGAEYGTTTGRPRRCGWFDGILLNYATRLNGFNSLAMTKLDVLSEFDSIKICTRYEAEGKTYDAFPPHQSIIHKAVPVYEEMPGWKTDIGGAKTMDELPDNCRAYIDRLQRIAGIPFSIISVGPQRDQTIFV